MTRLKALSAIAIAALLVAPPVSVRSQDARTPAPAAPGTVVASPIAFAGGWDTVMNRTERYTLVLQITTPVVSTVVPDIYVTGQMFSTDRANEYSGTLQGVVPRGTRTLQYSYTQPAANRGGTGQLILSLDGNSISGSGKAGDVYFTWRGTRAR
jgi:hypothetical protein